MDATEYELRKEVKDLKYRVEQLEKLVEELVEQHRKE